DKDAFYVADLGDILKKHLRWLKALPRVTPFYAVKSNDSRAIVNTLAAVGTGFDCASKTEIQLVQGLGVPPERIIYANPCKQVSQIKYAASSGVQMMTFDSEIELMKVARAHPKITSVINPALDKYFPPDSGVRVIAEPGRYYVASAFTLAVNIIAKKMVWKEQTGSDDEDESNEQTFMYYVNDGVYGSFNCILYDHAHVKALLPKRPKPDEKYYPSSIWGPTCDGLDRIIERCNLPEMHVGDWMLFENMGAYTVAAASTFNGFQRPSIYYVMSRPMWQLMKQIQSHGFPPEVEEQDVGTLPMSCAQE
ncbi:ornithine decarboxylase, partial [Microtus ochrogaster]|uniref:Ornithine decarboxylase n=1 Tax=Microtus ochrogaster TaxID=79684 RepID=A0ABM0LTC7_MICOH